MSTEEEEFYCEFKMGIRELRALYSHLEYAIKMWPGAPARPYEEQEFLDHLKKQTFAMITEYNFHYIDKE
tara:strand:- start:34258 stop:34467 length:210 start_codon:yes stop_codon:yes gene_type:complete